MSASKARWATVGCGSSKSGTKRRVSRFNWSLARKQAALLERRIRRPGNTGQPWSAGEDARLVDAFDAGQEIAVLAEEHGRTKGAITSRLTTLGKMMP